MGGWAKHAWVRGLSLPVKKYAIAFLQKIFGLNLHSASKIFGTAHPLYAALSSTLLTTSRAARQNPDSSGSLQLSAPGVGFEPTTYSLTGSHSTVELPRNIASIAKVLLIEKPYGCATIVQCAVRSYYWVLRRSSFFRVHGMRSTVQRDPRRATLQIHRRT